jgi:hypothetical protein
MITGRAASTGVPWYLALHRAGPAAGVAAQGRPPARPLRPGHKVRRRLGDPFFGVRLNPGHFIHLDEWPSSPVYPGSDVMLASGMTLQLDIIPATASAYHTTNIEDGVALADEAARDDLADRYPGLWRRVTARRQFMAEVLGIRLRPEVLPLSDLAGYLPPYWLAPQLAMRRAGPA